MHGSTVLVTGGTGGIGLATATGLAGLGARVGVVGRSAARGVAAADAVRQKVPSAQVDLFEHTFALNHLAQFLLTHELLDLLVASAPARVVTVSSGAQAMGRIDLDDLQGERAYSGQRAYNQSKLANVLFSYELARRLGDTGVTATVLHPGVTRTAFGQEDSLRWMRLVLPLVRPFMKTPDQGASTVVHLASSPEVDGVTRAYYANRRAKRSAKASYDRDLARRLWEISAVLVGVEQDRSRPADAK